MRAIILSTLLAACQAATAVPATKAVPLAVKTSATVKPPANSVPLASKSVPGHVQLSAEQKKTMHWGCVNACKPSPVESKCVTACEAASYRCIDETGPGETPKDTKKCQDGVLKLYKETKGLEKKEKKAGKKGGKKDAKKGDKKAKKAEKKKAKSLLQVADAQGDDDDGAEEADADQEQSQDGNGDGDDTTVAPAVADSDSEEDQSLVQVTRSSDDDDSAEEADADEEQSQDGNGDGDDTTVAPAVAEEDDADEDGEDESLVETGSSWKPEPCGELAPGVPCTHLYEHPQGSTVVMPCPVEQQTNPEACGALFGNKADGQQCSQITCPKALGVTMKLICGGGCCPSCWAPDHVINLDRHSSVDDAAVVDPAPQAPSTCGGVKCFKTACAAGFTEGFVNGDCCYSCVPGR